MIASPTASTTDRGLADPSQKMRSQSSIVLRRIFRSHHAIVGLTILGTLAIVAIVGPLLLNRDPLTMTMSEQFLSPSWQHPFGTDEFGRDILTRVLHGARLSLRVGILATLMSMSVGSLIGLASGFYGGTTDLIVQRLIEVLLAFPGLLLALAIVAILGPGLDNIMIALGIGGIPGYTRLVRAQVLATKSQEYVEAARVVGVSNVRLMMRHILPANISTLVVIGSIDLAENILAASSLSFIGLGAQPPTPEWGAMLSSGRDYMREQWWISAFPGMAIAVAVLGFNLLGDGLRDALDPRGRN